MRSLARALSALGTLAIVFFALAGAARAQTTNVVVLGLTSIEGDDSFAANLSGALRQAASQVRGWAVSDRDVLLSQLELATGCEASELSCVQQIANTVGAQRLVYGTIQRTEPSDGRYNFRVRIHLYDTATNTLLRSLDERLPSSRTDIDDLREPARRFASTLAEGAGTAATSTDVGLPPEGQQLEDGGAGTGGEQGGGGEQGSGGEQTSGSEQSSGGGGDDIGRLNWPAFGLIAVGLGSAVAWILAGLDAQTNMQTVSTFRGTNPRAAAGASDLSICNPQNVAANEMGARADEINGACSSPAEILQFVFMGTAIIAGAAGIGLLAANGFISPAPESDRVSIRLLPRASLNGGSLGLELTF
jgi:uncharacterized membrane protein YgcG